MNVIQPFSCVIIQAELDCYFNMGSNIHMDKLLKFQLPSYKLKIKWKIRCSQEYQGAIFLK